MSNSLKENTAQDLIEIQQNKNVIDLSSNNHIDLTNLGKEAQALMTQKANEAKIDLMKKAQEAQIDIQATKVQLDGLNAVVRESSRDGSSITVTHTQTTSIGRTEGKRLGNTYCQNV